MESAQKLDLIIRDGSAECANGWIAQLMQSGHGHRRLSNNHWLTRTSGPVVVVQRLSLGEGVGVHVLLDPARTIFIEPSLLPADQLAVEDMRDEDGRAGIVF